MSLIRNRFYKKKKIFEKIKFDNKFIVNLI